MKRFKFRLERILHYRNIVRDEKRRVLALAVERLRVEREQLVRLEQEFAANTIEGLVLREQELAMRAMYAARLREEIARQRERIATAEEEVLKARAEYIEASKEAKALTTLRERKLTEYKEEIEKEDGKFLDELMIQGSRKRALAELEEAPEMEVVPGEEEIYGG